ncbi:glycosyltransferase family 2 protein [Burkholderiaceae bacterium UC74_6]
MSEPLTFVGIVTVLYNSDEVLSDFFSSLAKQNGLRLRLYVIDNGSTDSGSILARSLATEHHVDAVVIFNNANVGVARGNNQGIELALADGCTHVLLANNDTAFGPGTIGLLLDATSSGELVATPKIMYFDEPELIWYGGGRIDSLTMRTPHFGMMKPDKGQLDHQTHVGYAPTCFMMIASSVFERVGLMDESFFVYYDDTDFVWRLARNQIRIRYVPHAVVMHKVSTSTGGAHSPFTVYYANRNRIYFIRKNLRGMRAAIALAYVLLTRVPSALLLQRRVAARLWSGIRDGFRMAVTPNER